MGKIPLKLSVSKTKCWNSCKKQFEYNYILHLPKIERDYHIFGKMLHKALEDFHQLYLKGWLLPANEAMSTAFKTAKAEFGAQMKPEAIKEAFDILCKYLRLVSNKSSDYMQKVISTEEAFNFPLTDNIILNGFIDKVNTDDDGLVHISDYKSTKDKRYLKNDWFQLMTYAFVVMHNKPELEKVRVSYVMLRHDFEEISKEVSREEAEVVRQQYIDYARDIESADEYPANPTRLCGWCDFIDVCAEGKKFIGKEVRHGEIDY
jgi:RecB family exonuclease